jgi:hypothetical protein
MTMATTVASAPTMTTSDPESVDGADGAMLRAAVARAVDFRGDVTLELHDGSVVEGFAFDARLDADGGPVSGGRDAASDSTVDCIRVLPTDSAERRTIPLSQIARLSFTGKDAASGKSWENWVRRYAAKKLAGEAASIESDAL